MKYNTKLTYKLPCQYCHRLIPFKISEYDKFNWFWIECKRCNVKFNFDCNGNGFYLFKVLILFNEYLVSIFPKLQITHIDQIDPEFYNSDFELKSIYYESMFCH